jgi:D-amino-acid dehydrogenase
VEPTNNEIHVRTDGPAKAVIADKVVIAAGIWSRPLARTLGDQIPLDTERGYNATYPKGSFGLHRPIMFEGEGFVTTPLDTGDRVGGAVEFAGLDAKPNHERTSAMVGRLKRFLPDFEPDQDARRWMGFRAFIPDSLPVIGSSRQDNRVVYAFGHGHHGLTQAAVTSLLVADLIDGLTSEIDLKPYSAQRF